MDDGSLAASKALLCPLTEVDLSFGRSTHRSPTGGNRAQAPYRVQPQNWRSAGASCLGPTRAVSGWRAAHEGGIPSETGKAPAHLLRQSLEMWCSNCAVPGCPRRAYKRAGTSTLRRAPNGGAARPRPVQSRAAKHHEPHYTDPPSSPYTTSQSRTVPYSATILALFISLGPKKYRVARGARVAHARYLKVGHLSREKLG